MKENYPHSYGDTYLIWLIYTHLLSKIHTVYELKSYKRMYIQDVFFKFWNWFKNIFWM